jgi:hypothetical protein
LLALFGMCAGAHPSRAQVIVGAPPANLTIDGDPGEWGNRPASMPLVAKSPAARDGRVWVAQSADALIIAARIGGPLPHFAKSPAEMAGGDHVEVWLALIDDPKLPKIGWGNQFGPVELESADACTKREEVVDDPNAIADCRAWFARQEAYRHQFRKLFVRQWTIAPGSVAESFARPAFAALPEPAKEQLAALAPSTAPENAPMARFTPVSEGGYGVEIAIPWSAFPPSPSLDLTRLRLMLDVVSPTAGNSGDGTLASTSPERRYGEPTTFNLLQLEPTRHWRIGGCGYPLSADDQWGERTLPGYFLPVVGEQVNEIFVIENDAAGYQYAPDGYSPVITTTRFFSQAVTPDLLLCGPPMAVRRGAKSEFAADLSLFPRPAIKPVAGGWLVADGPYVGTVSRFGSGVCGACPLISLQVLFLPAAEGPPVVAFSDSWIVEDDDVGGGAGRNARVAISDDLQTITAWVGETGEDQAKVAWTRLRRCYDPAKHTFLDCGVEENAKPPFDIPMPADEPAP